MPKKYFLFLLVVIFFSLSRSVFASPVINEIMYDLSGSDTTNSKSREWIEVYNSDANTISVDASKWRIYDGSANRTINGEVNFSVPAGSYIIFAGDKDTFLLDHSGFSGVVYDTGITSLNNTGATLKILDQDGNVVDSVTYASSQGAAGDGNSLQKISGSWVGATPTPGVTNAATITSSSAGGLAVYTSPSSANSSAPTTTAETKNKTAEEPKLKAKITAKTLAFAGIPVGFQGNAFGYSGEKLYSGKYFWNFGDGDSKEMRANENQNFTHTYFYAGEYDVTLEYYMNYYSETPDASDRITVKVVPADISISRVGDEKDFFVELSNNTGYDADLSGWIIASSGKSFSFPRNTIIGSKKKMIISSKLTNFSIEDKNTLKLMTPQGDIAFDYPVSIIPVVPPKKISVSQNPTAVEPPQEITPAPDRQIPIENLSASVVESNVLKNNDNNSYSPMIISLIAFVFIGGSAGTVYFIRQKKIIPSAGDDFKMLDE